MIEKDENPIEYDSEVEKNKAYIEALNTLVQPGKMIMPGPPVYPMTDRDRRTALKLLELAIDVLREKEPVPRPDPCYPMFKEDGSGPLRKGVDSLNTTVPEETESHATKIEDERA